MAELKEKLRPKHQEAAHRSRAHESTARRPKKYEHVGGLRRAITLLIASFAVVLIVEGFNQGSVPRMLNYLSQRTFYFAFNWLIVLTAMSLSELFKHRRAVIWTFSALWIVLGFANYMVCRNRTQPLVSGDLLITREILGMITVYFSWPQIILMALGALAIIGGAILLYARTPVRRHINYYFAVGVCAGLLLLTFVGSTLGLKAGLFPTYIEDRVDAYYDYGFSTCFTITFGSHGISKPDEYSPETVEQILEVAATEEPAATASPTRAPFDETDNLSSPNIVFLQLESFFDLDSVIGATYSEDPMPNFHALLKTCPNGKLYVPTVGGGTANVEFEVMSGMNMDFFGAGETPYNTIMQTMTCETIADILNARGYTSTALHDNTGTFFSRNEVYANLGYDRFVPLEYMLYPEYTEIGWARDILLRDEILKSITSTDTRDLIFAIGVESHGKYKETYTPKDGDIEILSLPEDAYLAPFQNYVNTVSDVDAFVGELIDALNALDEPTICIIYGDHLPALGLDAEMLTTHDLYTSHYVIWNNFGASFDAPDLQAYRLSAYLFKQLGITEGVLNKFHQSYAVDESGEEYLKQLEILEYDLLYGEQDAYGEHGSYQPTDIQLGVYPITVDSISEAYGRLLLSGSNFTEFSHVIADGTALVTVFIDDRHIAAKLPEGAACQSVCVAQINSDGVELGRTEAQPVG